MLNTINIIYNVESKWYAIKINLRWTSRLALRVMYKCKHLEYKWSELRFNIMPEFTSIYFILRHANWLNSTLLHFYILLHSAFTYFYFTSTDLILRNVNWLNLVEASITMAGLAYLDRH